MKSILRNIAGMLPVPMGCYQLINKQDVVVLCYHLISNDNMPHITLYDYKNTYEFESDIQFLIKNFSPINYAQYRELCYSTYRPRSPSFLLTFDDGFSCCFSVIRPILNKYGLSAIFFIATDYMDDQNIFLETKLSLCVSTFRKLSFSQKIGFLRAVNKAFGQAHKTPQTIVDWIHSLDFSREQVIDEIASLLNVDTKAYLRKNKIFLTREEIKTLADEGFAIGAHGKRHIRLDLLNENEAEQEIVDSSKTLMELIGINDIPFAFPYHGHNISREFLARMVARHCFIDCFFGIERFRKECDFIINRIVVDGPSSMSAPNADLITKLRLAYIECVRFKWSSRWGRKKQPLGCSR